MDILCTFCKANRGIKRKATHIAAQSHDGGQTVTWEPICRREIEGWNDGGDWKAPIYKLGDRVPNKLTVTKR